MKNFNEELGKTARTIWRHGDLKCEIDAEELLKDLFFTLLDELKGKKATESDGWENAKQNSCCPGDDWADGFNKREQELRTKIEEIKKSNDL